MRQRTKTEPHHTRTGPCQACYTRDLPEAPRCDINNCKGLLRTAEGRLKVIQNFEKLRLHEKAKVTMGPYPRAKGLLNDASFRDTGPLEHSLPPASVDPTITYVSPNTSNRRNTESRPRQVLSRRPPSLDYQNYASAANRETVCNDFPDTNTQDVLAFTAPTNYKMNGSFTINPSDSFETIMVLDTEAGPNCSAARYLPPGWQKKSSEKHEVTLQAANGKPVHTRGSVHLWIRLGNYIAKDSFLVCDQLPVPIVLGSCSFRTTFRSLTTRTRQLP